MFKSIVELHRYMDLYCKTLYEKMDYELIPQVLLDVVYSDELMPSPERRDEITFYHTNPVGKDNSYYLLSLVFDTRILDSYYRLPDKLEHRFASLLDAIIAQTTEYLNEALTSFVNNAPFVETSVSDLIKKSGKLLVCEILKLPYSQSPFNFFNKISALSYESSFSNGSILLLDPTQFDRIETYKKLRFKKEIPLSSHRHVRKILELCNAETALLSDGVSIYATVDLTANLDTFTIEFNSPLGWQLNYNHNKLMQVTYEEAYIPKPKISFFEFSRKYKHLQPNIESKKIVQLYRIILEATKQKKGTILIISKNARSEAYRLRNQGFLIEPLPLKPELILSITSIDGAVLLDPDGVCHGIGVILDGLATEKGDPSRGARYNSVVRYVHTIAQNDQYTNCISVVISEDGYVDIISEN